MFRAGLTFFIAYVILKKIEKMVGRNMTTMIFVRHGQSLGNLQKEFLGHTDLDLSELGYQQAECAGAYIAEHYVVDKIYASDLIRAYHTAEAAAKRLQLPIIKEPKLREIYAGDWEKKTFTELEAEYPTEYQAWLSDIGNAKCTNGETVKELQKRVLPCVEKIAKEDDGKTVLIATHATVLRVLECAWRGKTLDEMKHFPWVRNASVSVVTYENGKWTIQKIGDDSFLKELASGLPANV